MGPRAVLLLLVPNISAQVAILRPKMASSDPIVKEEATKCYEALQEVAGNFLNYAQNHYESLKKLGVKSIEPTPAGDFMDVDDDNSKKAQQPPTKKIRRENSTQVLLRH